MTIAEEEERSSRSRGKNKGRASHGEQGQDLHCLQENSRRIKKSRWRPLLHSCGAVELRLRVVAPGGGTAAGSSRAVRPDLSQIRSDVSTPGEPAAGQAGAKGQLGCARSF